jgi:hypothetical protein
MVNLGRRTTMSKPELKQGRKGTWYVEGDVGRVKGDVRCVDGNVGDVWGNVGLVEGNVRAVLGDVQCVEGNVRAVLGDVLYNVIGTVRGTINRREWKFVKENNDER